MTTPERLQRIKKLRNQLGNLGMELLKVDPWISITLNDNQEYKLEYSYGAALEVFEATGLNINVLEIRMADILKPSVFPELLLAGFSAHEPMLHSKGVDALMSMISMRHMTYYATCIAKAMEAAQPDAQEVNDIVNEIQSALKEEPESPLAQTSTSSDFGADVEFSGALIERP